MPAGEVRRFRGVGGEIVELPRFAASCADEFPIAHADRLIAWHAPAEGLVPLSLAPLEGG